MPTYAYACRQCDHRFEAVQAFTDASLTECPDCSGTLRKVFSSVGIVFKGSGFYRTDSRKAATAGEAKADAAASSNGSSSTPADAGSKSGSDSGGSASTSSPASSTTSTTTQTKAAS